MPKNPPKSLSVAQEARIARRAQDDKIVEHWENENVRSRLLLPAAGLNDRRGKNRSPLPEPTTLEHVIAAQRAARAFETLKDVGPTGIYLGSADFRVFDDQQIEVRLEAEATPNDPSVVQAGIPLIAMCTNAFGHRAGHILTSAHFPTSDEGMRDRAFEALAEVVMIEDLLWRLAGERRIPYPIAFYTLEHFGRPGTQARRGDLRICLQCGEVGKARNGRRLKRAGESRLCDYCSRRQSRVVRPEYAIMPAHRGKWVIQCQALRCEVAFIGQAHARFCEQHRIENVSPLERPAFRSATRAP